MAIDIDTINLDIAITEKGHLTYNGHYLRVHDDTGSLSVRCPACGESMSIDSIPDEPYKWEVVLYFCGTLDSCDGTGDDLEEEIRNIMQKYVGKPADQGRMAAIENDIRDVVGDDVPINIQ